MAGATLVSCNSAGEKNNTPTAEMVHTQESSVNYELGDHVPNDLVCMVNNAYMGKPQMEVPVDGKMYYGCCEMCVGKLNNEQSARTATDPYSGNPVDKAEAYIVLTDGDGRVAYFESEENYHAFMKN